MNQSADLNISWFSLKYVFKQTWRKMITRIHSSSIASGQRSKFSTLQKLPCNRTRKYISQIKFSPLPNYKEDRGVKFQFIANFTFYFTFSCLIFTRDWSKGDSTPFYWFRNVLPIHPCYYNSPIIMHGKVLKISS